MWSEMRLEINDIIKHNNDIETLVEELIEFIEGENIDEDDRERAEAVLYGNMDRTNGYIAYVRLIKPRLRRALDVHHFDFRSDDDVIDEDSSLSQDQIDAGIY